MKTYSVNIAVKTLGDPNEVMMNFRVEAMSAYRAESTALSLAKAAIKDNNTPEFLTRVQIYTASVIELG